MTLPSSNNPISLGQIQTEFGGSDPIALAGEYYRNGSYTTSNNTNVPTSGTISLSNFYGAYRYVAPPPEPDSPEPDPCVVQTVTTEYGEGFQGYLLYGKGFRENGGFITGTNSTYRAKDIDGNGETVYIITKGKVETTYTKIGEYIVDYYTKNLGRYPDGDTFSSGNSWFYEFLNIPGYTSFSVLGDAINTAFYGEGGESGKRVEKGGLIGNYDSCNVKKT